MPATAGMEDACTNVSMPATETPSEATLVGTRIVAKMLDISLSTFQKWCAKGPESGLIPTPVYRIGGQLKWRPADVEAHIESQRWAA